MCQTSHLAVYPDFRREPNPYSRLLYEHLAAEGVTAEGFSVINDDWLREQAGRFDGLHLHWPESIWRSGEPPAWQRAKRVAGLYRYLSLARRLGLMIVWTCHNLEPHERAGWLDFAGMKTLASLSDLVVVHSQSAADSLNRRFGRRRDVIVMPHGNYAGVYPSPRPREQWDLPGGWDADRPLAVCLGNVRPYKGFDVAAEAARQLGEDVQVVIAGQVHPEAKQRFEAIAASNLTLIPERLTDQQLADLAHAADALLLPYRKITGSGALWMAWTLGRAVVASDLPYFREFCGAAPQAARLFPPGSPAGLAAALQDLLQVPAAERQAAALAEAAKYPWSECVKPLAAALLRRVPARGESEAVSGHTPSFPVNI